MKEQFFAKQGTSNTGILSYRERSDGASTYEYRVIRRRLFPQDTRESSHKGKTFVAARRLKYFFLWRFTATYFFTVKLMGHR